MSRAQWMIPVLVGLGIAGGAFLWMPGPAVPESKGPAPAATAPGAKPGAKPAGPGANPAAAAASSAAASAGAAAMGEPGQLTPAGEITPEQARRMVEELRAKVESTDPIGSAMGGEGAVMGSGPGERVSARATDLVRRTEATLEQLGKSEQWSGSTVAAVNAAIDRYEDQLTAIQTKAADKSMSLPQALAAIETAGKTVTDDITKAAGPNAATEVAKQIGQPTGDEADLDGWGIPFEEWAAQVEAEGKAK